MFHLNHVALGAWSTFTPRCDIWQVLFCLNICGYSVKLPSFGWTYPYHYIGGLRRQKADPLWDSVEHLCILFSCLLTDGLLPPSGADSSRKGWTEREHYLALLFMWSCAAHSHFPIGKLGTNSCEHWVLAAAKLVLFTAAVTVPRRGECSAASIFLDLPLSSTQHK